MWGNPDARPMSRAALALALLLLPALAAPLAEAQAPGAGLSIPTQRDVVVGGLNVTVWVMRDTRSLAVLPDIRENYLGFIWNLNFTAGSLGVVMVKAQVREPGAYVLEARVASSSPLVQVVPPEEQADKASGALCAVGADAVGRCTLQANRTQGDLAFQFSVANSAPPGPLPLWVEVVAFDNATGTPQRQAAETVRYEVNVLDPLPAHAVRRQVGETTLASWVHGGLLGASGTGCLAGSQARENTNISQSGRGVICVLATTRSPATHRLNVTVRGADWLLAPPNAWQSPAFNVSTGGLDAPVNAFVVQASLSAPVGPAQATVHYVLEQDQNGTWARVGEGELLVPFSVAPSTVAPTLGRGPNWLFQAPLLLLSVGGLGYLAYQSRRPKLQPRSQALRAEMARKSRRRDDEPGAGEAAAATEAEVAQQRQEVQEAAWDKKRKILDAKRDDILKSIRIAEERHQRGEITEHVLNGIRERKERQLEQVQKELEELQG